MKFLFLTGELAGDLNAIVVGAPFLCPSLGDELGEAEEFE
jgi:hypothetical protein